MPKKLSKKLSKNKSRKTKKNQRRRRIKGGNSTIHNYGLNTYANDPNYMQVSARNVIQYGSSYPSANYYPKAKTRKSIHKGGGALDFLSNQLSNSINNFPNSSLLTNGTISSSSAAYIQPIGNEVYTGDVINK